MFFYGHPQNRFWKVLSAVYQDVLPVTVKEKQSFLKRNRIAVWDVIHSCNIEGSSDSSITDVTVNNLILITETAAIDAIYINGKKAYALYNKYIKPGFNFDNVICLPSTSPANAAWSLERLIEAWQICAHL